jgi:hypothetical protein
VPSHRMAVLCPHIEWQSCALTSNGRLVCPRRRVGRPFAAQVKPPSSKELVEPKLYFANERTFMHWLENATTCDLT